MFSSALTRLLVRPARTNLRWLAAGAAAASCTWFAVSDGRSHEVSAGKLDDLIEGRFKKVQVGPNEQNYIAVTRVGNEVFAVGGRCSHWGVPLLAGFADGYTAYCPAHCAGFDVRTGQAQAGPGFDNIPSYKTRVNQNGDVIVTIPEADFDNVTKTFPPQYSRRDPSDTRSFVIIGGGAAGFSCAENLRKLGYGGRIQILTSENLPAYDRPMLSKNLKGDAQKDFLLRGPEFYESAGIEVQYGATVKGIDEENNQVVLQDGSTVEFTKLLIATGCSARVPRPYQSALSLPNVLTIRSSVDHENLKQQVATATNIVIIGGSFLGTEVSSAIKKAFPDKKITIVELDELPLRRVLGEDMATQILQSQRKNGIRFLTGIAPQSINEENGKAASVSISWQDQFRGKMEEELPADLVIVTTGAQVNTGFVPPRLLTPEGFVKVSQNMQTNNANIYAAGDIASFFNAATEQRQRIEHWAVALDQGAVAAKNMLGQGAGYQTVPFFWTNQFINVQFVGFRDGADWYYTEAGADGSYYITYFYRDQQCVGASLYGKFGAAGVIRAAIGRGVMPKKDEIAKVGFEGVSKNLQEALKNSGGKKCCGGRNRQ